MNGKNQSEKIKKKSEPVNIRIMREIGLRGCTEKLR